MPANASKSSSSTSQPRAKKPKKKKMRSRSGSIDRKNGGGSSSGGERESSGGGAISRSKPRAHAVPRAGGLPQMRSTFRKYLFFAAVLALVYVATNGFVVLSHLQDSKRSVPVLRGIIHARVKGVDTRLEDVLEELESVKKRLVESNLEHERRLVALEVSSHLLVEQVKILRSKRTVQAVLTQQLIVRELEKRAKEAKASKQSAAKIKKAARARNVQSPSAAAGAGATDPSLAAGAAAVVPAGAANAAGPAATVNAAPAGAAAAAAVDVAAPAAAAAAAPAASGEAWASVEF